MELGNLSIESLDIELGNLQLNMPYISKLGETKNVTPSISIQEVMPTDDVHELTKVIIDRVTSEIDENITPENIKQDVDILGVVGTLHTNLGIKEINKDGIYFASSDGVAGYDEVHVSHQYLPAFVKSSLENQTILPPEDVSFDYINVEPIVLQEKSVTPTKNEQNVVYDDGNDGLKKVIIEPIPANYIDTTDATATASDILTGETAYVNGEKLTGTLVEKTLGTKSINANGVYEANSYGVDGFSSVDVDVQFVIPEEAHTFNANGTYTTPSGMRYNPITVNVQPTPPPTTYSVKVFDFDGELLDQVENLNNGDVYTFPAYSHTGMIFEEWCCSEGRVTDNTVTIDGSDVIAIAMCKTASGKTEIDRTFNEATGFESMIVLSNQYGSATNSFTVEWLDGTTDTLTGTGEIIFTHTYTAPADGWLSGTEKISYDGNRYAFGYSSADNIFNMFNINTGNATVNYTVTAVRCADNVYRINDGCLRQCGSLKYVSLTSNCIFYGTKALGSSRVLKIVAFKYNIVFKYVCENCSSLETAVYTQSVLPKNTFSYCYNLKNFVLSKLTTTINDYAIRRTGIEKLIIRRNVTTISQYAISGNDSLRDIIFEENSSVNSIGNYAFNDNNMLTEFRFPSNNITMGTYVFSVCYNLRKVFIPKEMNSLGNYCFNNCYSLETVEIEEGSGLTTIGNYCFYNCSSLKDFVLPNSIASIGSNAFSGCSNITSMVLPENVNVLNGLFKDCQLLANIEIQSTNITSVSNYFLSGTAVKKVAFKGNITQIADYAFTGVTIVEYDFRYITTIPTMLGAYVFNGFNNLCKIYVPSALYDDIKVATYWVNYAPNLIPV